MSLTLERSRPESCLSDLAIDQLLAGEATNELAQRAHLRSCSACGKRWEEIEAEREAFTRAAPPLRLTTRGGARRRAWLWSGAAVAAAAAGVALLLLSGGGAGREGDAIRRKGGERLGFYVQHAAGVRQGGAGEVVHPGDSLRFTYSTDEARYLAIISVDAAAQITSYFPLGATAVRIEPGSDVAVDGSTIVDEVLGSETIYALFCDSAIALEPTRARFARAPHAPPLPRGCVADRLIIEKRPP